MLASSQHGGKVPTFEAHDILQIWLIFIKVESWLCYVKSSIGLVLKVRSHYVKGKIPTFEAQDILQIWLIFMKGWILNMLCKIFRRTCVESWVLFFPQPMSTRILNVTSRKCCIHAILGTWDLCEVASPNFHALNGWDCTDRPQMTWNLGNPGCTGPN